MWDFKEKDIKFADSMLFFAKNHFPMQKWEKMLLRVSWGVMAPPVMSAREARVRRRSSAMRSVGNRVCSPKPSMTRVRLSWARQRAS